MIYDYKERILNFVVGHLPAILQILFMERVMKIVRSGRDNQENDTQFKKFGKTMSEVWPKQATFSIWKRRQQAGRKVYLLQGMQKESQ